MLCPPYDRCRPPCSTEEGREPLAGEAFHSAMTKSAKDSRPRRSAWSIWVVALLAVGTPAAAVELDRSPIDLVLSSTERWLFTANQTAGTVSVVDVAAGTVVQELPCGKHPAGLALSADDARLLVTTAHDGNLVVFAHQDGQLVESGRVFLGFEPEGIAITADGARAYVALSTAAEVAEVDLEALSVKSRIGVGHWPRHLALSADGTRLAVGTSGDQSISVIDTAAGKLLFQERFGGINTGHLTVSADNRHVYFPWMVYRQNVINPNNIRAGWVLGSRIARIKLDAAARREAFTLDPRGLAVSDPYGIDLTSDESHLVASAGGTHELLIYRLRDLVFQDHGGPGDHIDPVLLGHPEKFARVELGGRPLGLRISRDDQRVYVANYLLNAVQVVDLERQALVGTFPLGGPAEPSLARQGAALFYDGRRSLDQWYSCHSCHYEGGSNSVAMDTLNDGTDRTFKAVLPLFDVADTAPWTWHGWQTDLESAMHKSLTETMEGPEPTAADVTALLAFLAELPQPPNPYRDSTGALSAAALRGQQVFAGAQAGCATCHTGKYFTDGEVHDVGLGSSRDIYQGHNTPSLVGLYRKVRWLHDGRGKSLDDLLTGPHEPSRVAGAGQLTDAERADLIEYLKSL